MSDTFEAFMEDLEKAIFAAAYVRFLDEDTMQAGNIDRIDATLRAIERAKLAVDLFREARAQGQR
jgi:hypothetical protein